MVTLHEAIKTIHNGVFVFFLNNKNLLLLKKTKQSGFKTQKAGGLLFLKKTGFSHPDCFSILFVIFP